MREHGTRSAARPQEDARKEFKDVLDLGLLATVRCGGPYLETGVHQAMREHPTTDRVVRHQTDALPEGEPWFSMTIWRRVVTDTEMLRLAIRRAGSRELAEDAIQETARALGERKSLDAITNLRGFFYVSLVHEIDHQLGRPSAIPAGDAAEISGSAPGRFASGCCPAAQCRRLGCASAGPRGRSAGQARAGTDPQWADGHDPGPVSRSRPVPVGDSARGQSHLCAASRRSCDGRGLERHPQSCLPAVVRRARPAL